MRRSQEQIQLPARLGHTCSCSQAQQPHPLGLVVLLVDGQEAEPEVRSGIGHDGQAMQQRARHTTDRQRQPCEHGAVRAHTPKHGARRRDAGVVLARDEYVRRNGAVVQVSAARRGQALHDQAQGVLAERVERQLLGRAPRAAGCACEHHDEGQSDRETDDRGGARRRGAYRNTSTPPSCAGARDTPPSGTDAMLELRIRCNVRQKLRQNALLS